MDCTEQQYKEHLQPELLKMGYKENGVLFCYYPKIDRIAINNGVVTTIKAYFKSARKYTHLGQFNAPLFLAQAAMTDNPDSGYGEWLKRKSPQGDDRDWAQSISKGTFNEYWRKATLGEIVEKFGGLKQEEQRKNIYTSYNPFNAENYIHILFQHCFSLEKGQYYYCKIKEDGSEWVFISSGKEPKSSHLVCACLDDDYVDIHDDARITNDDNISLIRIATDLEKKTLDKRIASLGKYFDKDKCKIMPIMEKCSDLTEDTAQELIRVFEESRNSILSEYIKILKKEGYKVLRKKESWEEV